MMEVEEQNASTSTKHDGPETIEQKIIALARERPKGISDKDLAIEIPDLQPVQRAQIINKLLSQGYFDLFKQGDLLFYRLKDPAKLAKCADNEEKIIYRIIEEAENKGISIRNIKSKSNLRHTPTKNLQKILASLEAKELIKVVKHVVNEKKMYMLEHLKPDDSVTGGVFYDDKGKFKTEFVDMLIQLCYRFLKQKREEVVKSCDTGPITARNMTFASSEEVWKFISDLGITKLIDLTVADMKDVERILNTLIYDDKVERILAGDGSNLYRAIQLLLNPSGLIGTPCSLCLVRRQCRDEGPVEPIKCQYIREWLE